MEIATAKGPSGKLADIEQNKTVQILTRKYIGVYKNQTQFHGLTTVDNNKYKPQSITEMKKYVQQLLGKN